MDFFLLILLVLIPVGALLALAAGLVALRSWLKLRRTRLAVREEVSTSVERLAGRTGEIEEKLKVLDARAGVLPVHLYEIQQSLTTLKVLTRTLATSANRAREALSRDPLHEDLSRTSKTRPK